MNQISTGVTYYSVGGYPFQVTAKGLAINADGTPFGTESGTGGPYTVDANGIVYEAGSAVAYIDQSGHVVLGSPPTTASTMPLTTILGSGISTLPGSVQSTLSGLSPMMLSLLAGGLLYLGTKSLVVSAAAGAGVYMITNSSSGLKL